MKKIALFLVMAFVFEACNDKEENKTHAPVDSKMIIGEWVTTNLSQDKFTDINFLSNQRVKILLAGNDIGKDAVYKEDTGFWTTEDESFLSFTMYGITIPQHKIIEINDNYIQLRNLKYNTLDTYYHVVETVDLNVGTYSSINYLERYSDLSAVKIVSYNTDVATVSSDGIIRAIQGGIAFISVDTGETIVYIKVIVKSRLDIYSEEVKLDIDDVSKKYGDPDKKFKVKNTDLYMYEYLKSLTDGDILSTQYFYNQQTREIAKIVTKYSSSSILQSDFDYLNRYYYSFQVNANYTFYGKNQYRYENSVLIYYDNGETGQSEGMHYNNNEYYSDNVDIGDPNKETYNELYLEPYQEWGGNVSDVKSYMSNYLVTYDVQPMADFFTMQFKGIDYKGNKISYQYDFKFATYGLYRIKVYLIFEDSIYEDIRSHLLANGFRYQYTDHDWPGGVYSKELYNGHTTVGVYKYQEESGEYAGILYLFTD